MQDDISGWSEWDRAFSKIEEINSPSELHGLLTGIICVTHAPKDAEWKQILGSLGIPELDAEALQLISDESEDVAASLSEEELDYLPLLPDDEHPLHERVQALADWCAGVVLGFGLSSGHIRQDEIELIEHLQDVAAVEFEESDDDEEGEESYQELYEFVRLIPVSLSVGRKKVPVEETTLVQKLHSKAPEQAASAVTNVVEMFTPNRLS